MPSKPASFTAWNFSITVFPAPTVAYMIPFLMDRFLGASAAKAWPLKASALAAAAVVVRKSRRVCIFVGDASQREAFYLHYANLVWPGMATGGTGSG